MVFNNTKVFPARLYGNKEKTGAQIEVFLLRELNREQRLWDVLVDPARKIRIGNKLYFGDDDLLVAEVIDNTTSRGRTLRFLFDGILDGCLACDIHRMRRRKAGFRPGSENSGISEACHNPSSLIVLVLLVPASLIQNMAGHRCGTRKPAWLYWLHLSVEPHSRCCCPSILCGWQGCRTGQSNLTGQCCYQTRRLLG